MLLDKILASVGLARLPRQPREPRPLWEENGYRIVVSARSFKNGHRTVRYLALQQLDNHVWREIADRQYLRHPCFSYDSKSQARRKLQKQARELWADEQRKLGHA